MFITFYFKSSELFFYSCESHLEPWRRHLDYMFMAAWLALVANQWFCSTMRSCFFFFCPKLSCFFMHVAVLLTHSLNYRVVKTFTVMLTFEFFWFKHVQWLPANVNFFFFPLWTNQRPVFFQFSYTDNFSWHLIKTFKFSPQHIKSLSGSKHVLFNSPWFNLNNFFCL